MRTIRVEGIEEINQKMKMLGRNLKERAGRNIIRKALTPMMLVAKNSSPTRRGNTLKGKWSIMTSFNDKQQAIGWLRNQAFYALYVETGHKVVSVQRKGNFNYGRRSYSGGRIKRVSGFVKGQNVLRNAFESQGDTAVQIAAAELGKALDKALAQVGAK
jgi:HK97 gp10 family phage protein